MHGLWLIRGETANRERWPQPPPLNFSKIDSTKEDVCTFYTIKNLEAKKLLDVYF